MQKLTDGSTRIVDAFSLAINRSFESGCSKGCTCLFVASRTHSQGSQSLLGKETRVSFFIAF
jgi:hypothetical protein